VCCSEKDHPLRVHKKEYAKNPRGQSINSRPWRRGGSTETTKQRGTQATTAELKAVGAVERMTISATVTNYPQPKDTVVIKSAVVSSRGVWPKMVLGGPIERKLIRVEDVENYEADKYNGDLPKKQQDK